METTIKTTKEYSPAVMELLRIFLECPWYIEEALEEELDGDEMTERLIQDYMEYEGYSEEVSSDMYSFGTEDLFSEWTIRQACWEVYYNTDVFGE